VVGRHRSRVFLPFVVAVVGASLRANSRDNDDFKASCKSTSAGVGAARSLCAIDGSGCAGGSILLVLVLLYGTVPAVQILCIFVVVGTLLYYFLLFYCRNKIGKSTQLVVDGKRKGLQTDAILRAETSPVLYELFNQRPSLHDVPCPFSSVFVLLLHTARRPTITKYF